MYRILFILFLALSLSACASTLHTYGNKTVNSSTLTGPHHIDLIAIDGDPVKNKPDCTGPICTKGFEIYLDTGVHTIAVKLATGNIYTDTVLLNFYAEPNEYYEFKHSETEGKIIHKDGTWRPIIINKSTNNVVSY